MLSHIEYVTDAAMARAAVAALANEDILGLDIETSGLDPHCDRMRLVQLATQSGRAYVFDLSRVTLGMLRPVFDKKLIVHNAAFEYAFFSHAGIPLRLHDSMLLGRLTHHALLSLKELSRTVLGIGLDKSEQTSDWTGRLSQTQIEYAALDALLPLRIGNQLLPQVDKVGQRQLYSLWRDAVPVLGELSLQGQAFDWDAHAALVSSWQVQQQKLRDALQQQLGDLNPNSGPQLGRWLSKNLDSKALESWPKTATGRLKTDADTLSLFANLPAVAPLLAYKQVTKLLTTYGRGYLKHRHPVTNRLHPSFVVGYTRSGRLAARTPNVQNPPRLEAFRELFIPAPGKCFVGADFSQIELRVAALLSGDRNMLTAYQTGEDLHRKTAAAVAGVSLEAVTDEQRSAAKAINFGTLYGQGPYGLARTAKLDYGVEMTKAQARQSLTKFDLAYPILAHWQRNQIATAQMFGQVKTKLGLIRDFVVQGAGYLRGESQNIPIQGSAAEVLLSSVAKLPAALKGIDASLYHNIHDELLLEVSPGDADKAATALQQAMKDGFLEVFPEGASISGDLVDVMTGYNWAQVH